MTKLKMDQQLMFGDLHQITVKGAEHDMIVLKKIRRFSLMGLVDTLKVILYFALDLTGVPSQPQCSPFPVSPFIKCTLRKKSLNLFRQFAL